MIDSLHVFPDTNVFLHYPPLSQIDWCALCDASQVQLVVCLQVIHELDEKKSDSRLGDRAVRAIKEIRATGDGGQPLRDGVTLSIFNQQLHRKDFTTVLNPDSGDDRIVHLAMLYRDQNSSQEVAVATEDLGMELRCKAGGISVVRMDTITRLPNPQDELTKKYKQAVTELNSLKNRLPDLAVQASAAGEVATPDGKSVFELSNTWQPIDIEAEIRKIEEKYPRRAASQAYAKKMCMLPSAVHTLVSQGDWTLYDRQLDEYYSNYRNYLEACSIVGDAKARSIAFDLWLHNVGNGPAGDIDVYLVIPSQIRWMALKGTKQAKVLNDPTPPEPPKEPEPLAVLGAIARTPKIVMPRIPALARPILDMQRLRVGVRKQADESHVIHVRLPRLKHGQDRRLGTFFAVFGCWEDMNSFQAEYTISTTELPDHISGSIPFVIRVKT